MIMEKHFTVKSNLALLSCELYATHVQHSKFNGLNRYWVECTMVVKHSMPINQAASVEFIFALLNMKTFIYPLDIKHAQTNVKWSVLNKATVSEGPDRIQNMQTWCNCGQSLLQIYENQLISKIICISGLQNWSKGALWPRNGRKLLRNDVST